jgi:hypothetical protein
MRYWIEYLPLARSVAIPHFESAIKKTNIAGTIKACQEQLTKARAAAGC